VKKNQSRIKRIQIQAVAGDNVILDDEIINNDDTEDDNKKNKEEVSGPSGTACIKLFRKIKGIIFDFDGTLFDNKNIAFYIIAANPFDWMRIWKERRIRKRFEGRDFSLSENYYNTFFRELGKACFRSPEHIKNWYFKRYMPRMIKVLKKHYKPRPDLDKLLHSIENQKNPLQTAVYSDYPFVKERFLAIGLTPSQRIKFYGPESFGAQKPAVRPFLTIASDFGLSPEEILVIGDREDTDGLGAFNSGMHFFCLETGHKHYYRLDPYRQKPENTPQGPTLLMYAGTWNGLYNLIIKGKM